VCTYVTYREPIVGSAKGPQANWFRVTDAVVYFDHPVHAMAEHTLNVDLVDPSSGPAARVAVELTADSARRLVDAIEAALLSAGRLLYLVVPLVVWAAWRFGPCGASVSALIVTSAAIWSVEQGIGPFTDEHLLQRMATLQIFNATVAFASFVVAAIVAERDRGRRRLEEALEVEREAGERLKALDELRRTFLHAVSHELRTPLTSVLGIALTLQRDDMELAESEQHELVGRLAFNARRLDHLLRDLLDLDRLDRGILEPKLEPADLGALVSRLVADLEMLKPRRVHLQTSSVVATVDPSKVERIVENLLSNAVRHTPEEASIWIRVEAADGGGVVTVEDDGPGVPPALRTVVFEPFHRAADLRPSPGLGIGLSLVVRFAELQQGRVWLDDRLGGGASFHVFLPDRRSVQPASRSVARAGDVDTDPQSGDTIAV
jgi:signal transduction histidine kinase